MQDTMTTGFRIVCWALALYFFIVAHLQVGFPHSDWTNSAGAALALSIFLVLLPFAKSLSLGGLLNFHAKIDQVKDEVKAFKDETRNVLQVQSAMITRVSQNVATTVNLPSLTEAYSAQRRIVENAPVANNDADDKVSEYIAASLSDPSLAVAKLRMALEVEFRRILGKPLDLLGEKKTGARYLSLRSLWQEFFKRYPDQRYLLQGIEYVNDIGNAAVHGQLVSAEHAAEALEIGLRILEVLRRIKPA